MEWGRCGFDVGSMSAGEIVLPGPYYLNLRVINFQPGDSFNFLQ
jgi:hypothetical protein